MIPEKAKIKAATNAEVTTDKTKERGRWTTGSAVKEAEEEGITCLKWSSSSHFFADWFFCSFFHLLICCSYSVGNNLWHDLLPGSLTSNTSLFHFSSINIQPLKQMVCYQQINMCTPWDWKQDHKTRGRRLGRWKEHYIARVKVLLSMPNHNKSRRRTAIYHLLNASNLGTKTW